MRTGVTGSLMAHAFIKKLAGFDNTVLSANVRTEYNSACSIVTVAFEKLALINPNTLRKHTNHFLYRIALMVVIYLNNLEMELFSVKRLRRYNSIEVNNLKFSLDVSQN